MSTFKCVVLSTLDELSRSIRNLTAKVTKMATTVADLAPELAAIRVFLEEAQAELTAKVAEQEAEILALEEALSTAGNLSPEVQDHVAAIRSIGESMAGVVGNPPPPVEPVV
jgi:hypothetical protein